MIRLVRLLGYAWLSITAVFILGLLGMIGLRVGFDMIVESLSLIYVLIFAGALLPGLLMVLLEIKEERTEDEEDRKERE
jgi:hypothetical protein